MKPRLTSVLIEELPSGGRVLRLDFDNDRHHVSRVFQGDRDEVAGTLYLLVLQLQEDQELTDPAGASEPDRT